MPSTLYALNLVGAAIMFVIIGKIATSAQTNNANRAEIALHRLPTREEEILATEAQHALTPYQTSGGARY